MIYDLVIHFSTNSCKGLLYHLPGNMYFSKTKFATTGLKYVLWDRSLSSWIPRRTTRWTSNVIIGNQSMCALGINYQETKPVLEYLIKLFELQSSNLNSFLLSYSTVQLSDKVLTCSPPVLIDIREGFTPFPLIQ